MSLAIELYLKLLPHRGMGGGKGLGFQNVERINKIVPL